MISVHQWLSVGHKSISWEMTQQAKGTWSSHRKINVLCKTIFLKVVFCQILWLFIDFHSRACYDWFNMSDDICLKIINSYEALVCRKVALMRPNNHPLINRLWETMSLWQVLIFSCTKFTWNVKTEQAIFSKFGERWALKFFYQIPYPDLKIFYTT